MTESTLSTKNQVVVPKEARLALGLKAGDKLLFVVRGTRVVMMQKPASYHAAINGLAGKAYPARYLEKERQSWK